VVKKRGREDEGEPKKSKENGEDERERGWKRIRETGQKLQVGDKERGKKQEKSAKGVESGDRKKQAD